MNIGKILQIIGIVLFAIGFLAKLGSKLFLETDFFSIFRELSNAEIRRFRFMGSRFCDS